MPRTKNQAETHVKPPTNTVCSAPMPDNEVLTLAEAAAFFRVSEADFTRMLGPQGIPGRQIGSEWRFLKSALRGWLATLPAPSSKEALLAVAGSWKDDPTLDEMLKEIYQKRGRPMTEEGE